MKELIGHSVTVFLALFAAMKPIANAAVFIGLTRDCDQAPRKRIALKSIITAFCIVLFFCVLGKAIFELFGITLPAFRITGGVLVFIVGFQMLQGKQSNLHHPEQPSADQDSAGADSGQHPDVAISPLAMPMMGLTLAVVGTQMLVEGVHGATKVF